MSDYLPDQVLAEIFFRLPAKTVLDCRCVCKSWCSVITNPNFISEYNKLSFKNTNNVTRFLVSYYDMDEQREIFTLHHGDYSISDHYHEELELPFDHGLSRYMIIGFCCGLVCLLEISKVERLPQSLLIWNPSVGYSFKTFPIHSPVAKIDQQSFGYGQYGPSIQFSQGKILVSIFGFGYVPKTNDYKVVRIVYHLETSCVVSKRVVEIIDVLTLSTGEWENITEAAPPYLIKRNSVHASVNGAVHWIGYYEGSDERSVSQLVVAVFDMYGEVFKEFNLPSGMMSDTVKFGEREVQKISVAVIKQSLALLHYHSHARDEAFLSCSIWLMNEYGSIESWTKLYNVTIHSGVGKILGNWRKGELLVGTVYNWALLSFHPRYRTARRLTVRGEPWCYYGDAYMECLVICKKIDGVSTMSTSSDETTTGQELETESSSYKITDKGKEILEE
ncbi:hypothetical protein AB3S75_043509 [Citrus x aurantiifolia]